MVKVVKLLIEEYDINKGELPSVTQNLESNPKEYPNLGQRQK